MRQSGIYTITNTFNNKKYIGCSCDIHRRWEDHKRLLLSGQHQNRHLQKSWDKYGNNCFVFDIVEECKESLLPEREVYWGDVLTSQKTKLYNIATLGGFPPNLKGVKKSESCHKKHCGDRNVSKRPDAREKIRQSKLGHKNPNFGKKFPERVEKISGEKNFWYGKKRPEISERMKGKSHPMFGKKNNLSPRAKLSWDIVGQIRSLYSTDQFAQIDLAVKFNVSPRTIYLVVNNKSWIEEK